MFPEVDPILGPEMRSTGEVLGMADSSGLAFYKSQEAAQQFLPLTGKVLISVAQKDRSEILEPARVLKKAGLNIVATEGTYLFLAEQGIEAEKVLKLHEGRPNILDSIMNGEIKMVINTPAGKQSSHDDSYIRKASIKYKVPYVTTTAAALAAARGILACKEKQRDVKSLQQYHKEIG